MKNIKRLNQVIFLVSLLFLAACKEEVIELNENLSAVTVLNLPAENSTITLAPTTDASVTFNWEEAVAEDGNLVLYEVALDKESGDFSQPVFKSVSDGGGVEPQLTLTHKELTKIAAMGGIESSSTGKLKWTIIASKASNQKVGAVSRLIQLTRPAGFAEVPTAVYLTGSATESGDDVTKAIPLKRLEAGIFEVYTSLKPGTYQLTDSPSAQGKKFFVEGSTIKEGASTITVTDQTKTYRLRYDFNVATALVTEIESIGLFMSAYNTEIAQLTYAGNGKWEANNIPIEFYQFSWGRDERYKFIVHTPAGLEYMGSQKTDNVSPAGQPAPYFYLVPVTNDQWNNTYKFTPAADKKNVRVILDFSSTDAYTHQVIVL